MPHAPEHWVGVYHGKDDLGRHQRYSRNLLQLMATPAHENMITVDQYSV